MNGRSDSFADSTGMELKLYQAYQRIISGNPQHKELQIKARNGRLKLSFTNLAMEAGCSRTLISLKNCAYPKIRQLVISDNKTLNRFEDSDEEYGTLSEKITQQAKTISILKSRQKVSDSVLAAYVRRLAIAGQQLDERVASEISKKHGLIDPDNVAGVPLYVRSIHSGNIVKVGKRDD